MPCSWGIWGGIYKKRDCDYKAYSCPASADQDEAVDKRFCHDLPAPERECAVIGGEQRIDYISSVYAEKPEEHLDEDYQQSVEEGHVI